ncbi:MAG: ABC transporter ATP-binding protein [Candidatus Aquicultor sp.]
MMTVFSASEHIIQTFDLTKTYGKQRAVNGLNITVRREEIYGFLGKNGAGKTTTVRMLLALIKPTNGFVEIMGKRISMNNAHIFKFIGSMVETPTFYPNLTVYDNLDIKRKLVGLKSTQPVDRAIELAGLEYERDKRAGRLSLGNKQRLGLARALLHSPDILILDE